MPILSATAVNHPKLLHRCYRYRSAFQNSEQSHGVLLPWQEYPDNDTLQWNDVFVSEAP
jgi:hypothetical protein